MFGISSPISHLLSILISYVTLSFVLSLFKFWQLGSDLGHYLGNDGEEGVTAEINKCAECDSRKA